MVPKLKLIGRRFHHKVSRLRLGKLSFQPFLHEVDTLDLVAPDFALRVPGYYFYVELLRESDILGGKADFISAEGVARVLLWAVGPLVELDARLPRLLDFEAEHVVRFIVHMNIYTNTSRLNHLATITKSILI